MKILLSVVPLMFPGIALAQSALEPIPPAWLHGKKLVAEEFNFSIESPNPDSHWFYARDPSTKSTAFDVDSTDTNFGIVIWDKSLDSLAIRNFLDAMRQQMPKESRAGDITVEPSAFPLKDSLRIKTTTHLPKDAMPYAYSYVVTGKRTHMLVDYSLESSEPLQFRRFVGSFALLSASANTPLVSPTDSHTQH